MQSRLSRPCANVLVQTTSPPPAVTISVASPTQTDSEVSPCGAVTGSPAASPLSATSQGSSCLLTPPASPDTSSTSNSPARGAHRRVVSAGALPSLDQIRQWSERRTVSAIPANAKQRSRDEGFDEGDAQPSVEVSFAAQPLAQGIGKKKENRLDRILRARPVPTSRIKSSVSVPNTPVIQLTREILIDSMSTQREERAKQMVNVLGKRRSLTTLKDNS